MSPLLDTQALIERLRGYNPPDRTVPEQRQTAQDIAEAAAALTRLRAENARLKEDVYGTLLDATRLRAQRAEAERDALRADAELLMLGLSSAWFYGNWKAETYTEREMQEIMERQGYWPTSEPELVTRRVAIDAARKEGE